MTCAATITSAPLGLERPRRRVANTTVHIAGIAGVFLAAGMLACAVLGWGYDDPDASELAIAGLAVGVVSLAMWRTTEPVRDLSRTSAFTAVGFAWIYAFFAAALPYVLAGTFDNFVHALFEAVSGLTTTGSTVLADIDAQGEGIKLYRQYTQWFGGGGIVLLAVAILQGFGVGGLELAGAEIAGPSSERIAPRIATTARRLWSVYVLITVAVAGALLAVGVGFYDAVAHALTTIPTAGFSTYNASIGQFDSAAVEAVLIVGMLAGATNFALQFRAYTRGPRRFLESPEFRTLITVFVVAVAAVMLININDGMSVPTSLRESAFNVATTLTTCGYGTSDFTTWAPTAQLLLLVFMIIGGMTGSTSGGIKMLRFRVVIGHLWRDLRQARQPRGVFLVRLGRAAVSDDIVARIGAFVSLYLVTILAGTVLLTIFGQDLITAFSGAVSDIGLVGPALGEAGPHSNFLVYNDPSKIVLICLMFLGRMELYVALLMFGAPANAIRTAGRARQRARRRLRRVERSNRLATDATRGTTKGEN
jgi:trk system potassium uptake protein TrkH